MKQNEPISASIAPKFMHPLLLIWLMTLEAYVLVITVGGKTLR